MSGASTPVRRPLGTEKPDQQLLDFAGLNLQVEELQVVEEEIPKATLAREKLLEEVAKTLQTGVDGGKKGVNLVIIGHVDAGKSTLMGRMLYELGKVDEKERVANERASDKIGKSSFSWAWQMDGTAEERERGITMDIALDSFSTPRRHITILDAPGHRDFIPNMISGASQADCALLVVDASTGEFEAGFDRGGQTREHLILVRSLGVSQVVVAVNKLDVVGWDRSRYAEIVDTLKPFLLQTGFQNSKTKFAPVAAMTGVNLVNRDGPEGTELRKWYKGPTLVDLLDKLEPPARDITSPFRFPISNVFKGSGSATGVTGRVCAGAVQTGEKLRIVPGDESGIVKMISYEGDNIPWAAAGQTVTLYMTAVDPIHLNVGSILCPSTSIVPLATTFTARIIVFDITMPITAGTSVELFHHSQDIPAYVSKLLSTVDRSTGKVVKKSPRVLTKGVSAEVQIALRSAGGTGKAYSVPLETFATNKEMGRVLIRRGGETVAAGMTSRLTQLDTGIVLSIDG